MHYSSFFLMFAIGSVAGFMNISAGGGSLLTLPLLIFLGLPSAVANGTNRVAIMVQNVVALVNFRRNGYFDWKLGLLLGIPALIGSIAGSFLAVSLPDYLFNRILAVVMIISTVLIIWEPQKRFTPEGEVALTLKKKALLMVFFLGIGVYGGFIQAAIGFIIIASLAVVTGMSLVKINSLKVIVITIYLSVSLAIFVYNGKVDWILGLGLAAGNATGAFIASNMAVKKGDKWIRAVLIASVIFLSLRLLLIS